MVVNDVGSILKSIKTLIEFILCEVQSIQSILEITNEQFPIYEGTLYSLQHSINNIQQIYTYKIPIQHLLKFNLLEIIHSKLRKFSKILNKFAEWNTKIIKPKCLNFSQFIFLLSNPTPSKILKELEKLFIEIEPIIKDQISLEEKILGTAIRIEHPILQKAWLMVGGNQLSETELSCNIIIDNLYSMLLIEQNNYIPSKEYYVKKITDFVKSIDGIAGSLPDDKISITEFNLFKSTEENSKSVKLLLNINDKDAFEYMIQLSKENNEQNKQNKQNEENEEVDKNEEVEQNEENEQNEEKEQIIYEPKNIDIPTNFKEPVKVNYLSTRTITEPLCTGYGADFNNINGCEFNIPNDLYINDKYKLFGVDIECVANDQGFGGTNQCHMRYQINDEITVKVFQIDRNQFPNNIYKFSIPPEQIKLGDTVKLWIFAPAWNCWLMILSNVKASGRFVPC